MLDSIIDYFKSKGDDNLNVHYDIHRDGIIFDRYSASSIIAHLDGEVLIIGLYESGIDGLFEHTVRPDKTIYLSDPTALEQLEKIVNEHLP